MHTFMHTIQHRVRTLFVASCCEHSSEIRGVSLEKACQILGNDRVLFSCENQEQMPAHSMHYLLSNDRIATLPYSVETLREVAGRRGLAVWNGGSESSVETIKSLELQGVHFDAPNALLHSCEEKLQEPEWTVLALRSGLLGCEYRQCERSLMPGTIIPDVFTLIGVAASVFYTKGRALFGGRWLFSSSVYRGERVVVSQSHDGRTITLALVSLRHKAPGLGVAIVWQPY